MRKVLKPAFFNRKTNIVAQDLLGKFLVRRFPRQSACPPKPRRRRASNPRRSARHEVAMMIMETESYDGPHDKASHAHKGKTKRTEVMFGPAGYFYIYLCYGMYYMLNVVTGPKEYPAAVLIRAGIIISNLLTSDVNRLDGPAKLTKALRINKDLNAQKASVKAGLWFEDRGVKIKKSHIKKTPRIGVSYAEPVWSRRKMRFVLSDI